MNSTSAGQPTSALPLALPLTVPGVDPFSCSRLTLNLEKSFSGGLFVFWGFHVESFIKVLPFTEVTSTCLEEKAEKGWGTDGQTFFFFFPSHQKGWEEENSSFQTCSAIPVPVFKSFGNFREENQRTAPAFLEAWMNNFAVDSQVGTIISHSVGPLQKCHIKGCNHINKLRHFTKLPFKGRRDSKPSIRRLQMMNTD